MPITVTTLQDAFTHLAARIVDGYNDDVVLGKVQITASVADDETADPAEADCYSDEDIQRFREGSWKYIGIRLVVSASGIAGESTLWDVENGLISDERDREYYAQILGDLWQDIAARIADSARDVAALASA